MKLDINWLLGLQKAEFARATHWRNCLAGIQLGIASASICGLFVSSTRAQYVLQATIVAMALSVLWLSGKQSRSRTMAERVRRATVLAEGVGIPPSRDVLLEIWGEKTIGDRHIHPQSASTYYATEQEPGPKRLGEILLESSYWTRFLQRRSFDIVIVLLVVSGLLTVVLFGAAAPYASHDQLMFVGRMVLSAIGLLVTQGLYTDTVGHYSAAKAAEQVFSRLRTAKANRFPQHEVMHIFADYNAILEKAPLPFPGVYRQHRAILNERWHEVLGEIEAISETA